jgi:hypothetical protein
MKTQKTNIIVVLLLISTTLFAQQGGQRAGQNGPPPIPDANQIKEMVNQLDDEISLSDEQEEKIVALYTAHFEEVKEKTSGNTRPNREEMEALKADFQKQVKALLSTEQQKGFETFVKNQEPKRRN